MDEPEDWDVCWICLQSSGPSGRASPAPSRLILPCACPRPVHESCLARWQLHCAGREEELQCRFCKRPLPHWRDALRPRAAGEALVQVAPVMSIQFAGQTYWLNVQMGQGGVEQFKADVRRLLNLSPEDEFDITFECQVPGDGSRLELHGLEAYDAAVYCASLTAAERMGRAAAEVATAAGTPPAGPEAGAAGAAGGTAPCLEEQMSPAGTSSGGMAAGVGMEAGSSSSSSSSLSSSGNGGGGGGSGNSGSHAGTTADFMNSHRLPRRHRRTSSGGSCSSSGGGGGGGSTPHAAVPDAAGAAAASRGLQSHHPAQQLQGQPGWPCPPTLQGSTLQGQAGGLTGTSSATNSSSSSSPAGAASARPGLASWLVSAVHSTYRWAAGQ